MILIEFFLKKSEEHCLKAYIVFQAPESMKQNWTEPQMVQNYGKACIPSSLKEINDDNVAKYSEDCLFLNVYVPGNVVMIA